MAPSGRQAPSPVTTSVEESSSNQRRVARSPSALEDCVAEPDQWRVRLEPLRLREERPEPRVAVVLLMGLVIRGDDVKDVILDAASLFAPTDCADEAGLEEPTPAREVVPEPGFLA